MLVRNEKHNIMFKIEPYSERSLGIQMEVNGRPFGGIEVVYFVNREERDYRLSKMTFETALYIYYSKTNGYSL